MNIIAKSAGMYSKLYNAVMKMAVNCAALFVMSLHLRNYFRRLLQPEPPAILHLPRVHPVVAAVVLAELHRRGLENLYLKSS